MDDATALLALGERIVVDVIAGLAIYFAYRLFLSLPLQPGPAGRPVLPGPGVTLARVVPALLLAAAGVWIIYAGFQHGIPLGPGAEAVPLVERCPPGQ